MLILPFETKKNYFKNHAKVGNKYICGSGLWYQNIGLPSHM